MEIYSLVEPGAFAEEVNLVHDSPFYCFVAWDFSGAFGGSISVGFFNPEKIAISPIFGERFQDLILFAEVALFVEFL